MRFFVSVSAAILFSFVSGAGAALADQNDPSLEALFLELRDGTVLDAEETTGRIIEIWSTAPSPTITLLYERAHDAAVYSDWDVASELAAHVTGMAPNFAQGWVLLGTIELNLGDYDAAFVAYEKALALEPRQFIATTDLADILYDKGEDRAAFDLYQQALRWNPHYARALERSRELRDVLTGQEI